MHGTSFRQHPKSSVGYEKTAINCRVLNMVERYRRGHLSRTLNEHHHLALCLPNSEQTAELGLWLVFSKVPFFPETTQTFPKMSISFWKRPPIGFILLLSSSIETCLLILIVCTLGESMCTCLQDTEEGVRAAGMRYSSCKTPYKGARHQTSPLEDALNHWANSPALRITYKSTGDFLERRARESTFVYSSESFFLCYKCNFKKLGFSKETLCKMLFFNSLLPCKTLIRVSIK